jgi:hypothetical protein
MMFQFHLKVFHILKTKIYHFSIGLQLRQVLNLRKVRKNVVACLNERD